ncbi:hypothetical protein ACRXFS_27690, partial [Klebsiella pneumoniae]
AGKKSAQIREILISESAWEEMTCLFAPSLSKFALYLSVGVWGGVWSVLRNLWILKSKENIKVKES